MQPAFLRFTLIFLMRGESVLMLHRRKAPNRGLWNGVGGHIEAGETPLACALREVSEETGLALPGLRFAGLVTWDGFETPPGGMYVFTGEAPDGEVVPNGEGELAWKPLAWVFSEREVVSNIPIFGPRLLKGQTPIEYRFHYRDGVIQSYEILDLPPGLAGRDGSLIV